MSDIHPDAVSLESGHASLETPPIQQPPVEPHDDDAAEPEGVVEHAGQRMVSVSVLAAERKRAREAGANAVREKELTPLHAKAQKVEALEAALAEVRPIIDHVRQYGLPQPPQQTPVEQQISDDEATAEARDLELYDSRTGQPDLVRAKRIIARRRTEAAQMAHAATQAAVGPITSQTAQSASRENFVRMATQRDEQNQPLVDARVLAEMWAQLPPELTAHPEVGDLVLNAAIGQSLRTGRRVPRPERGPLITEPSGGGRSGPSWQMDQMARQIARHAGMSDKQFTEAGKGYQPGATNVLGD